MNRWLSRFAVASSLLLGGSSWAAPSRAPSCDEGDVTQIAAGFRHACAVRADHSPDGGCECGVFQGDLAEHPIVARGGGHLPVVGVD